MRSAMQHYTLPIRINAVHVTLDRILRPTRLSDVQSLQPLIKQCAYNCVLLRHACRWCDHDQHRNRFCKQRSNGSEPSGGKLASHAGFGRDAWRPGLAIWPQNGSRESICIRSTCKQQQPDVQPHCAAASQSKSSVTSPGQVSIIGARSRADVSELSNRTATCHSGKQVCLAARRGRSRRGYLSEHFAKERRTDCDHFGRSMRLSLRRGSLHILLRRRVWPCRVRACTCCACEALSDWLGTAPLSGRLDPAGSMLDMV
jgi:hypothetical protein